MNAFLAPVGLGEVDSAVYVELVSAPRSSSADLAHRLGLPVSRIRSALQRLGGAGLVTRLAQRPPRYLPAPPDVALDALALRRLEELNGLRADARQLALRVNTASAHEPAHCVEALQSADAIEHHLAQLQLGARQEVLAVDYPPCARGAPTINHEQRQAMRRGVRYRVIHPASVLTDSGRLAILMDQVRAGEQARTLPSARMKMLVVDGRSAIIPAGCDAARHTPSLLVHGSSLLVALVMCFESLWERAWPVGQPEAARPGELPDKDRQLLAMLAAGMKDRAVARALGVTERTVTRRISQLMRTLDADTRFQTGLLAAKRGWL